MPRSTAVHPQASGELVRMRLLNGLLDADVRIAVLYAAAGFGKSTLARHMARHFPGAVVCDVKGAHDCATFAQCIARALAPNDAHAAVFSPGDERAMAESAEELWRNAAAGLVIFENAEALAGQRTCLDLLARLLDGMPHGRRVCICSRLRLSLPLARLAMPHEIVAYGERDLRFTMDELAALADGTPLSPQDVAATTGGWPLCSRLVTKLAKDNPQFASAGQLQKLGSTTLYTYLINEVVKNFDRSTHRVMLACAAIDGLVDDDLRRLYAQDADPLLDIARAHPLIDAARGDFRLHPLVRESIRQAFEHEAAETLRRAADAATHSDPIRAGSLYLQANDAERAAVAIEPLALGFVAEPSSAEFARILQGLPREVLLAHPRLFTVAMLFNGLSLTSEQRLQDTLEVLSRFEHALDRHTLYALRGTAANVLSNLGRHEEAQSYIHDLRDVPESSGRLFYYFLKHGTDARMGKYAQAMEYWPLIQELAANAPSTLALAGNEIAVARARAAGDAGEERRWLAYTLEHARRSKNPTAHALTLMFAIFSAWLRGDDAVYGILVAELDALVVPSIVPGTRLFRACVAGNVEACAPDVARPQIQAYAYLIALSAARGAAQRRLALLALDAADRANEPYLQALTRVAAALVRRDERARWLAQAVEFASAVDVAEFRAAVETIAGGETPGLFRTLEHHVVDIAAGGNYRLSILDRTLRHGNLVLAPSNREMELLLYLGYRDAPVSREELAEAFAPELPSPAADRLLRVVIARIRKKFGSGLIASERGTYALGAAVDVDLRAIHHLLERTHAATYTASESLAMHRALQQIEECLERRRAPYEWGEDLDMLLMRTAGRLRDAIR
jgi:DNA-binding response OmpR family regulator